MPRQFSPGDRVVKNDATWIPNDFDSWGRGIGVGVVVEPPFGLDDDEVDVRWSAGRCFERVDGLVPAADDVDSERHDPNAVREFHIDLRGVRDIEAFVSAFNSGLILAAGGLWNGNWDAFNDYLSWPAEDSYVLFLDGWDECVALSERDLKIFREILTENPHVTVRWA